MNEPRIILEELLEFTPEQAELAISFSKLSKSKQKVYQLPPRVIKNQS